MRLTLFSDFGLRALLVLAASERDTWSSAELAAKLNISRDHLVKVLQRLAMGGYVHATRGAGGGVRLAKAAEAIPLGDVLEWLEEGSVLVECLRDDGGQCLLTGFCALRPKLERARRIFYEQLNTETLADCMNPTLNTFVAAPLSAE